MVVTTSADRSPACSVSRGPNRLDTRNRGGEMRHVIVTPEDQSDNPPGLLYGTEQEYAHCVIFTERRPRQIRE